VSENTGSTPLHRSPGQLCRPRPRR
jgi:hypothetical protein